MASTVTTECGIAHGGHSSCPLGQDWGAQVTAEPKTPEGRTDRRLFLSPTHLGCPGLGWGPHDHQGPRPIISWPILITWLLLHGSRWRLGPTSQPTGQRTKDEQVCILARSSETGPFSSSGERSSRGHREPRWELGHGCVRLAAGLALLRMTKGVKGYWGTTNKLCHRCVFVLVLYVYCSRTHVTIRVILATCECTSGGFDPLTMLCACQHHLPQTLPSSPTEALSPLNKNPSLGRWEHLLCL